MTASLHTNRVTRKVFILVALCFVLLASKAPTIKIGNQQVENDLFESPKDTSITHIIAASSFPMNSETEKINLPESITTVVIDIGARESDYLREIESTEDEHVALLLFDPSPNSNIPLSKRVAEYSMRNMEQKTMNLTKSRQVFLARAAVGENEGIVDFNLAIGPACSSILNTSAENKFWCANVKEKIKVPIVTLKKLLPFVPEFIRQIHIKIDTEGADLAVLRGAGDHIHNAETIIIECNSDTIKKKFRDGECIQSDAIAYMEGKGFKTVEVKGQGDLVNILFANPKYDGPLPDMFLSQNLTFKSMYRKLQQSLNDAKDK